MSLQTHAFHQVKYLALILLQLLVLLAVPDLRVTCLPDKQYVLPDPRIIGRAAGGGAISNCIYTKINLA